MKIVFSSTNNMKPIIVFVDDQPLNLTVFESALPDEWEVHTYESAVEALSDLENYEPWVVVSDQRMPEMSGVEFLEQVKEKFPHSVRIIATGYSDEDLVVESVKKAKIYDYIKKPWDPDELEATLARSIEHYQVVTEKEALFAQLVANKKELEAAAESLKELADIPENNPNLVITINPDGEVEYINPYTKNFLQSLNLSTSDINKILPENYREMFAQVTESQEVIREAEHSIGEKVLLWTFSAVKGKNIIHGYAVEKTEERKAQQTAKVAISEKDKAIIANNAKTEFLSNMSHEIRTPLTAIIGYADELVDALPRGDTSFTFANGIVDSGKHLLNLINDVLDISKIESGHLDIETINTDIISILNYVESVVGSTARRKGLEFKLHFDSPIPRHIVSDPTRIRQILINIANNAVKFTDQGSITINIKFDSEDNKITFAICDSGIGMTPTQMDKLFKPYSQADASTARNYGGTGLGLYLSKTLSELLGGGITVKSELDEGSQFIVEISAGVMTDPELISNYDNQQFVDDNNKQNMIQLSGNILLADDNKHNQIIISRMLKKCGLSVDVVDNGLRAVESAFSGKYDIVLMDVQMPEMNGLDASRLLRERSYDKPVFALTADVMIDRVMECRDAGCDQVLSKPVDRNYLYQCLADYLPQVEPLDLDDQSEIVFNADTQILDLVENFIDALPSLVIEIEQALNDHNWELLGFSAHDLKGVAGNYGFSEISKIADLLMMDIKQKNVINCHEHFERIEYLVRKIVKNKTSLIDKRKIS